MLIKAAAQASLKNNGKFCKVGSKTSRRRAYLKHTYLTGPVRAPIIARIAWLEQGNPPIKKLADG